MEKLSSRERFLPLKKLAELWLFDFMQNEDIYLKTLIPTIISGDFSNFTKKESDLLNEIFPLAFFKVRFNFIQQI